MASKSLDIVLRNRASEELTLKTSHLEHGVWWIEPLKNVSVGNSVRFGAESDGMLYLEGSFTYFMGSNTSEVTIYFINPFLGGNRYEVINTNNQEFLIGYWVCNGYNSEITVTIHEKNLSREYSIAVMSDPQPWRLYNNDIPNSMANKNYWETLNRKVVSSLNILSKSKPIDFGVINGDITEFGRHSTRLSFYKIYDQLLFPVYYGLGNHDYSNNVGDCADGFSLSKNACARGAVNEMAAKILRYSSELLSHFSSDYDHYNENGSLAYSWDYGQLHYVQLQNYPTYKVDLDHYALSTIRVKSSLEWLETDLERARERGKAIVLNFHDAFDKFLSESSIDELYRFRTLIVRYRVLAIFCGHTHSMGIYFSHGDSVFGKTTIINSGALFKSNYYIVTVRGKCLYITSYTAFNGVPVSNENVVEICDGYG
ncbi:unnamed protein product [Nezara viridula]|uniref:Calcineurin-like phosphoesterase domain-containing protein n=1 Tax=Nezara viridula TaxID=85310 RepID=A0A9P0E2G2_NEZVI|nr:unnamed protein product [Nezara viridula]